MVVLLKCQPRPSHAVLKRCGLLFNQHALQRLQRVRLHHVHVSIYYNNAGTSSQNKHSSVQYTVRTTCMPPCLASWSKSASSFTKYCSAVSGAWRNVPSNWSRAHCTITYNSYSCRLQLIYRKIASNVEFYTMNDQIIHLQRVLNGVREVLQCTDWDGFLGRILSHRVGLCDVRQYHLKSTATYTAITYNG